MDVMTNDVVFGEMIYKHRWFKKETLSFLGKEWDITIVAKAFSGKPITDEQRNSYQWLKDNLTEVDNNLYDVTSGYINDNCQEFAEYWSGARMVNSPSDLAQIISLKTILFKKDGGILILSDCPWDEHGIAIQLKPDVEIGSQDMFL